MNPYTTDPKHIPESDRYADIPLYGRYHPQPNDFRVDRRYVNSSSKESLQYWATVLDLCTEANTIYPADNGRDVFALGGVIVKSSHRHKTANIDYTYADANEVQAVAIAKSVLKEVKVPYIYFAGQVHFALRILLCDDPYSCCDRLMVARCWSKKDLLGCVSKWHSPTYQSTKKTHSSYKHGRYLASCMQ